MSSPKTVHASCSAFLCDLVSPRVWIIMLCVCYTISTQNGSTV